MKHNPVYILNNLERGYVEIVKDSVIVGNAMLSKLAGGWLLFTVKDKFMGLTQNKDNIIKMFKRKKGLPAKPRPRPLCSSCPLHKVDSCTRKEIRRKALPR